jgi:serine/threonine protein phosphatase PrpC
MAMKANMTDAAEPAVTFRGALESAALSDVGLRRGNNQDSYVVVLAADDDDWRRRGNLFLVADGMGAHAAGELASKMACESIGHAYRKLLDRQPDIALTEAVVAANTAIHDRGQANAEFQGMGTTCSVLVLLPRHALIAHVGDSRVYRLRNSRLDQLTFDHSLVWEMQAAGQLPCGDVANFIPKNIITRSLGPHAEVQVDLEGPLEIEAGDTFLLCSDGLSGQVKDEEIGAVLSALSPQEAVRVLVDMANLRGGPDNITAIAARVSTLPTDGADEVEPLPPIHPSGSSTHPALWFGMAACLVTALALGAGGYYVGAFIGVLLAAAAAVFALLLNLSPSDKPATTQVTRSEKRVGPYATFDCTPSAATVAVLCQMAQQLRDAAKDEHWTLDWSRFNAYGEQAQAALASRDFKGAIRQYALAISFMMSEIRGQSVRKDQRDNSVLDI